MMFRLRNMACLSTLFVAFLILSICQLGISSPLEKQLKKIHLKDHKDVQRSSEKSSTKDHKTRNTQTERASKAPIFNGLVLTDALFSYGDVNTDDRLTLEEIYNFYKNIIGFAPSLAESTAANLVLIGDKNKDGVLDWTEVMEAIERMKKEMFNDRGHTKQ